MLASDFADPLDSFVSSCFWNFSADFFARSIRFSRAFFRKPAPSGRSACA